jgi:hypothetical protein
MCCTVGVGKIITSAHFALGISRRHGILASPY